MQSRPTEQPIMVAQKYFYFETLFAFKNMNKHCGFKIEEYDEAELLKIIFPIKPTYLHVSDTPLTLSELKEIQPRPFGFTSSIMAQCISEVIVAVEELKQSPHSSVLVQKETGEYLRRHEQIACDLMTVKNTSKLYFGNPIDVDQKAILNPAFVNTQRVKEEKTQRVAFVQCLVEKNVTTSPMFKPNLVTLVSSFFQETAIIKDSLVAEPTVQATVPRPTITK
jgi:hypothetical protein